MCTVNNCFIYFEIFYLSLIPKRKLKGLGRWFRSKMSEQIYLSNLSRGRTLKYVRVKILSLWRVRIYGFRCKTEMLLADEQGTKIEGTIGCGPFHNVDMRELREDAWYTISDFVVSVPIRRTPNTLHPFHIKFHSDTKMTLIYDLYSPNFSEFAKYSVIKRRLLEANRPFGVSHSFY
ncbi:uncharacterized protein LOC9324376 [Arabidopsis lyrata subsp. lyrata]|uniref:uncharacterized protein LOC9324376 n=1 Tax=Arabidopsis lyrata subsp. lyrata TaxID=81972 RepID=UPI000A29D4F6|nr:uncharacterized protein LOC9324376 [Arabidopsis lyrata subsp. lyrata]|eukprot:XP_020890965.1 uncharacterized protein LOC9324376 [Arabidopsis lyrata subsp. lyrata]